MFSWWRKKSAGAAPSHEKQPIYHWSDDEIPRYPPFMKGLPTVPPEKLLETQSELIERIADTAIATPEIIERYYLPAVSRFASYAHLLPASQSHHHRGAGGLLRHSIEVGLWALQSADKVLLESAKSPSQRREMEPRWQLSVFLAALCHDAGKPVTDMVVTNRDRTAIWKPIKEDLFTWASKNHVQAYFLDWREGRSRQHTALANLIGDRIIGAETLDWIGEGGTELIVWLMESLTSNPGPTNPIYDLVIKADQTSVERDLKTLGIAMAGYDLGVPVERHLTDIMRRLIKEGVWLVNEPGARLWNIGGHLYLIWPAAGEEMARQVLEDSVPGIPRTPDGILDMLVERQIAYLRDDPGDRFWKIAPACLAEKIPDIKLSAIRLRDEAMVSSVPIPAVEGRIVGDEERINETRVAAESSSPVDEQHHSTSVTLEVTPQEQPIRPDSEVMGAQIPQNQQASPRQLESPTPPSRHPLHEPQGMEGEKQAIQLDGAIGEALKALIQDIKSGDKRMGVDAIVDDAGHLLLRWPEAFSGYGLTPKNILDDLLRREWLWIDPMAPLRKVINAEMSDGVKKAIRLEKKISDVLLRDIAKVGGVAVTQVKRLREKHDGKNSKSITSVLAQERNKSGEAEPSGSQQVTKEVEQGKLHVELHQEATKKEEGQTTNTAEPQTSRIENTKDDVKRLPSIDDVLEIMMALPAPSSASGWREVSKRELISACRKRGVMLTHGRLADLSAENQACIMLDGAIVRFRPPITPS